MLKTDPIIIAGVGNLLRTDDGIGVRVVEELRKRPMPGVTYLDAGTAVLHSLPFLESAARVLIIDAAMGNEPPGTIYLFDKSDPYDEAPASSLHALSLMGAFQRLSPGRIPPPSTILGVQPESLAYGMELSPTLRAALPQIVARVEIIVQDWILNQEPLPAHADKFDGE